MDNRQILNALNAGSAWTAKWLADLADAHEGKDTDHLVSSARKALAQIEEAKASVLVSALKERQ